MSFSQARDGYSLKTCLGQNDSQEILLPTLLEELWVFASLIAIMSPKWILSRKLVRGIGYWG